MPSLEAMFVSVFCGFLRCGENCRICRNQSFDPSSDLCIGDLHRQSQRSVTASDDQQPGSPVSHPGRDSRVQDGSMTTFIGVSFTLGFLPTATLDTRPGSVLRLLLLPGTSLHT
ncbi:UNVERIFIED_CONTAM: hypothetical protein FKN15_005103 [Acipenser sinensis]